MKGIIIKKANKKDCKAIKKLIKLYPEKIMQTHLPKVNEFFIAKRNGQIVGCCALDVYSKRLAEIRSLVVHPKFQNKGIGTKLIESCLMEAKRKKILEVLSITGAMELFRSFGFKTFNKEKFALLKVI